MRSFIKVLIILSLFGTIGYTGQTALPDSIEPLYANASGLDLMSDAPWVVNKDDYIPFFFIIKDCDYHPAAQVKIEFYCIAVYDISDGIKYYSGVEIVPSLYCRLLSRWFNQRQYSKHKARGTGVDFVTVMDIICYEEIAFNI